MCGEGRVCERRGCVRGEGVECVERRGCVEGEIGECVRGEGV